MKTICFVVPVFPSVSETFITTQIIGAKLNGYSVCVFTSKKGNLEDSSQKELIKKFDILKDTHVLDYKIPKTKFKQLIVGFFFIIKYFKYWVSPVKIPLKHRILNWPFLLNYYSKFKKIDVFHVNFALGGNRLAEMIQNGFLNAKLIITFHGHDAHFKNEMVLKKLQNYYKVLFNVSSFVSVNTPYLKSQVISLGCNLDKLHVIPMAVDVAYFKNDNVKALPLKSEIKLISVGRLVDFKGFKYAIQTINILVKKGFNVHYTIVGDGMLLKSLKEQILSLDLDDYVDLVGSKNQEYIKNELQNHHLYLMSSITNAEGRCETQGVVTAEAQSMGLPVVAFNSGGIPFTIKDGETGILVPEKDVDAYSNAIIEIISNSEKYDIMSQKAREYAVNNFSETLMIKRFMTLYES